jgi:formamidopyrimidine-DNA glycosylase
MPELAEVEYARKLWDPGVGARVNRVLLHAGARIFRGVDTGELIAGIEGAKLLGSEARAKQMLFRFSSARKTRCWLGIHLGMSGHLRVERGNFEPHKHDHLILVQAERALVFNDARTFGRVRFHTGTEPPSWWTNLPPAVTSEEFTLERIGSFLKRRRGTPVKAVLLMQESFPGVGNWMADEILWRARINPKVRVGRLTAAQSKALWHESREVCRIALETVGAGDPDPPKDWLFHVRWSGKGNCPRCGTRLKTSTVGGRTTRWCPACQRARS